MFDWLNESSEHEPEEYDPEADFRDPTSDSLTIPEVSTDPSDVPAAVSRHFWAIVLLANVALGATAIGFMLLGFEGDTSVGLPLVAIGLLAAVFAWRRYRAFPSEEDVESDAAEDEDASGNEGSSNGDEG